MKRLFNRLLSLLTIMLTVLLLTGQTFASEETPSESLRTWMNKLSNALTSSMHTDEDGQAHIEDSNDKNTQSVLTADTESRKDEQFFYTDPKSGFTAVIEDDADLINNKSALLESMIPLTKHCNVMFKSINKNPTTTMLYAYDYLHASFGGESATIFIIDMDNRNIYIRSDGAICDRMTNTKSTIITDNVYTYASAKDYDGCAGKVFIQMNDVLEGYAIAEPMHVIGIALISLLLAMIICFIIINKFSVKKKASAKELMMGTDTSIIISNLNTRYLRTKKEYHSTPTGSGGGGSSGGGGGFSGGGGGGGFSGTGGGHSF